MIRPNKIKELLANHKANDLTFIDVGARGKLECIDGFFDIINMHGFEPDRKAYEALKNVYSSVPFKNLKLNPTALSDKKGDSVLFLTKQASMSSLLQSDIDNYQKHFGDYKEFETWKDRITLDKAINLKTNTLDSYFENNDRTIDFLKIDTQGTELSILKGAKNLLEQMRINIIKLEVTTIPVYKSQALFSEIDLFLKNLNYSLVDFITYPEEYQPSFQRNPVTRHSGPCGDAIYLIDTQKDGEINTLKKSLVLSWLGYPSLSRNNLNKTSLSASEIEMFLRAFRPGLKENTKQLLKNCTPPFIWQIFKNIKQKF